MSIDYARIEGYTPRVKGISDAGVYLTEDYDCGCTPMLKRWPFSGQDLHTVTGTSGSRSGSVVEDALIVARDPEPSGFGSGQYEIARVPLDGGDGEVLAAYQAGLAPLGVVVASADIACFADFEGPPSCVRFSQQRIVTLDDRPGESLVVIGDIAYWLRGALGSSDFELVAAAP